MAQSDAAAAFNWNGIEGNKAYERPEDEVTGNDGDGKGARRPVGDNSMTEAVRYQYYRSKDGIVLFMASEREFWKNFAYGIGRPELFDENPGAKYADHARGNVALRRTLDEIFATRTTAEWVAVRPGGQHADLRRCNDTKSITRDPQFQARLPLRPYREHRHRSDAVAHQAARRGRCRCRRTPPSSPAATPTPCCATSSATTRRASPRCAPRACWGERCWGTP